MPLPAPVLAALKSFKARQAAEKLVDEQGQPWKTDQLRRATYKLMAVAKVREIR